MRTEFGGVGRGERKMVDNDEVFFFSKERRRNSRTRSTNDRLVPLERNRHP
jgi:hypothetical protein